MTLKSPVQAIIRPYIALDRVPAPEDAGPEIQMLVDRWIKAFGIKSPRRGLRDAAAWTTHASQTLAAKDLGAEIFITDPHSSLDVIWSSTGKDPEPGRPTMLLGDLDYREPFVGAKDLGCEPKMTFDGMVWPDIASIDAVFEHPSNQGFLDNAGRQVRLARMPRNYVDESSDLPYQAALAMRDAAPGMILTVTARPLTRQKGSHPISFPVRPFDQLHSVQERFHEESWAMNQMEFGGRENGVVLEEQIELKKPYRVLVVDGVPVVGAGIIERMTPLHRDPGTLGWDPKIPDQEGGYQVEPNTAARYRLQAGRIAREIAATDPRAKDYVLELATNSEGKTVVSKLDDCRQPMTGAVDMRKTMGAMLQTVRSRHLLAEKEAERAQERPEAGLLEKAGLRRSGGYER